jgi:hypothetical protein
MANYIVISILIVVAAVVVFAVFKIPPSNS